MELLGRYKTLIEEVENRQPKTILEVGTHRGNSAITMVNKAKQYNDDVFIMDLIYLIGLTVTLWLRNLMVKFLQF